ncbi:MAG TPA: thiamine diphosphokinase, partial [Acidimicrobiales bacterium]|nr:thiamine diphosphokinase [Acidimicrobiales bacterium]
DGAPPVPGWGVLVGPDATVIAADGGARHARHEGVTVTDLVGDLDSLTAAEVDRLTAGGARLHRFDADKDFTDFELAAQLAARRRPCGAGGIGELLVVGGAGGRLDHALGNIAVLGSADLAGHQVTALLGDAIAQVASPRRPISLDSRVGQIVSLVPIGGTARGVVTRGMRFGLHREDLDALATRGISNVVADPAASVSLDEGTLIVIEPGAVTRFIADKPGAVP